MIVEGSFVPILRRGRDEPCLAPFLCEDCGEACHMLGYPPLTCDRCGKVFQAGHEFRAGLCQECVSLGLCMMCGKPRKVETPVVSNLS